MSRKRVHAQYGVSVKELQTNKRLGEETIIIADAVDYIYRHRLPTDERCEKHNIPGCSVCKDLKGCHVCGASTAGGHRPTDHPNYRQSISRAAPMQVESSAPSLLGRDKPSPKLPTIKYCRLPPADYIGPLCVHGRPIVNGIAHCGVCTGTGDTPESFTAFLESFIDLCGQEAHRVDFRAVPYEDRKQHAYLSILQNLNTIIAAKNPGAMARTIAKRRIVDLTRAQWLWSEWPMSQLNVHEKGGDGDKSKQVKDAGLKFEILSRQTWRRPAWYSGRTDHSLWTPHHVNRLSNLLGEGLDQLAKQHPDENMCLKLYFSFFEECRGMTIEDVANIRGLTVEQVKYRVEKALTILQKFIETGVAESFAKSRKRWL